MSTTPHTPVRVAVLLSGEGTTLESLCERIDAGDVPGHVVLVLSSRAEAGGLVRARRRGIPAVAVPRKAYRDAREFNDALHTELARHEVDLVACLGFLSPFELRGRFEGRALNTHPALIPAFCGKGFYGHIVHEAVLAHGCKVTGCTVHFADNEYDHGPIIIQRTCPVLDDDTPETLAARIFKEECIAYPEAIRLFREGRLRIEGARVRIGPPPADEHPSRPP